MDRYVLVAMINTISCIKMNYLYNYSLLNTTYDDKKPSLTLFKSPYFAQHACKMLMG